jgi:hypothetical protein
LKDRTNPPRSTAPTALPGTRPMKIQRIELLPIKMKPIKPDWHTNQAPHLLGNATVILRVTTNSG